MIDKHELEQHKKTVQDIIDKHLPKDKRFSVKDFNQEQLWYLCELLSENDSEKKQALLKEIENMSNQATYQYKSKYNEMIMFKELTELYIKTTNDLQDLYSDIDVENTMSLKLNNLNF